MNEFFAVLIKFESAKLVMTYLLCFILLRGRKTKNAYFNRKINEKPQKYSIISKKTYLSEK